MATRHCVIPRRASDTMREKKVWRYYCDFCRKAGCGKAAMLKHEAHCCSNPNRVCRMCARMQNVQAPMAELIAALEEGGETALRARITQGSDWDAACPMCILAAIKQLRKKVGNAAFYGTDDDPNHYAFNFDFKKERDSVFDDLNSERYGNVRF